MRASHDPDDSILTIIDRIESVRKPAGIPLPSRPRNFALDLVLFTLRIPRFAAGTSSGGRSAALLYLLVLDLKQFQCDAARHRHHLGEAYPDALSQTDGHAGIGPHQGLR